MRPPLDRQKLERFMTTLAGRVKGAGRIYLTGGSTALLHGWRTSTIDIDLKADPEPGGWFEALAAMHANGLIKSTRLLEFFESIRSELIRYPALDPASFRAAVESFVALSEPPSVP